MRNLKLTVLGLLLLLALFVAGLTSANQVTQSLIDSVQNNSQNNSNTNSSNTGNKNKKNKNKNKNDNSMNTNVNTSPTPR